MLLSEEENKKKRSNEHTKFFNYAALTNMALYVHKQVDNQCWWRPIS